MEKYVNEAALSKIIEVTKKEMEGVITDVEVKDEVLYFARRKYTSASEVRYVTSVPTEWGSITRQGVEEDSSEYVRTGYILAKGKSSVTLTTGIEGINIRVFCYDVDKNFLTNWYSGLSYQNIDEGQSFRIPSEAHFIRVRFSSSSLATVSLDFID